MARKNPGALRAGAAEADISPPVGVQLVGYPTVIRANTGIHDPLFAGCLVLDDGGTRVALITSDLVGYEKAFVARLRRRIAAETGIPAGHILLCGSHTHSGPRMASRLFDDEVAMGARVEIEYLSHLEEKLAGLVQRAGSDPRPAQIGFGKGKAGKKQGIGGNRHDPSGPADPAVGVIGVQGDAGSWRAALVKYSLHPTILQMDNTLVSADYPFAIRGYLTRSRPGITVLFAQGATGDQSSRHFRRAQTFEEAERFGTVIGKEADRVLDTLKLASDIRLAVRSAQVAPVWKDLPPVEELEQRVAEYWQELRELEARGAPYVERQTCYLDRLGTEFTLVFAKLKAEGRKAPWEYEVPIEVQAIRVGEACIVGIAGEIFVEYTLAIEKASPFRHTFIFTLANGLSPGYVVDTESAENKLFEAGASMLKPATGANVVQAAARLCRELYEQQSKE